MKCVACGAVFANCRQLGPHRRKCRPIAQPVNNSDSLSLDASDAVITEPHMPYMPTMMHDLARREPQWGQRQEPAEMVRNVDERTDKKCSRDLREVCLHMFIY